MMSGTHDPLFLTLYSVRFMCGLEKEHHWVEKRNAVIGAIYGGFVIFFKFVFKCLLLSN
jgi:hypothetical protein